MFSLIMVTMETGKSTFLVIIATLAKRKKSFIRNIKCYTCKLPLKKHWVMGYIKDKFRRQLKDI